MKSTATLTLRSLKLTGIALLLFSLSSASADDSSEQLADTGDATNEAESGITEPAHTRPANPNGDTRTETDTASEEAEEEWQRLGRGLRYRDLHVGDGESPSLWANVYVHYRIYNEYGLLLEDTFKAGNPQRFSIGSGLMPTPLEMAVNTMKERGRREILIPAEMFEPEDFRHHADAHGGNLDQVRASLRPGMLLRAELSLMWVRPYDPAERHRFR